MKRFIVIYFLIFSVTGLVAQDYSSWATTTLSTSTIKIPRLNLGAELQWYPAGWIYGARANLYLGKHTNWNFRIAYNDIDRKDFSTLHTTEVGGGFGASVGYRRYFKKRKGFFIGGRADFWDLTIDWETINEQTLEIEREGASDIVVFQPTVEIGYQFILKKHWVIAPTFTNGYEINMITDGEAVMQGFITLLGVNVGYKLF